VRKLKLFYKSVDVIISLLNEPKNITQIYRKLDINYPHLVKLIHELNDEGVVELTRSGRTTSVSLTEKGVKIAKKLKEIKKLVSENENEKLEGEVA
jgi:predicted transcriptional regulator